MILTRKQVKQLRAIFKQNKDVEEVVLVEENNTGIGQNMYVEYDTFKGERIRENITNYDSW